jgi:hypothetical protein
MPRLSYHCYHPNNTRGRVYILKLPIFFSLLSLIGLGLNILLRTLCLNHVRLRFVLPSKKHARFFTPMQILKTCSARIELFLPYTFVMKFIILVWTEEGTVLLINAFGRLQLVSIHCVQFTLFRRIPFISKSNIDFLVL